jgi:hypothetical protein
MPTTATAKEEHQKRWQEIVADPLLSDLPYETETNHRGQIVLSPCRFSHSQLQRAIWKRLDAVLTGGEVFPECPVMGREYARQTSHGRARAVQGKWKALATLQPSRRKFAPR